MNRTAKPEGAIVVGGFVNGLGIVRAFRARRTSVAVVTTQPFDIAQYARGVDAHEHVDRLSERPEALCELLERRSDDWGGRLVFPTNDEALASLSEHQDRLSRWYRLLIPPRDSVPYLLDKERMLGAAADVRLAIPRRYGPALKDTAARDDITYPVVVKPDQGHIFSSRVGTKLLPAYSREDLLEAIGVFEEGGFDGQVFDLIPGDDRQIFVYCLYVNPDGEPSNGVTIRKIRQSPASFGVSRVAELADEGERLREPTVELVRRIGLRGFAAAEYKLDPRDGSFRFIELNGRSVIYNTLLARGGLDTVELGWSDYVSHRVVRVEPTDWAGVWVHLHADVLRAVLDRSHEVHRFRDYAAVYRRRKMFAVWSARDPRPFVRQWARTAGQAPGKMLRRGSPST